MQQAQRRFASCQQIAPIAGEAAIFLEPKLFNSRYQSQNSCQKISKFLRGSGDSDTVRLTGWRARRIDSNG
jgi:hypothetical protein